jgi:hypothetical protein
MKKTILFTLIALLIIGIVVPSLYCQETEERSFKGTGKGEAIIADLIFLRPLGVASSAIGFAATIVSLPFICCRGNGDYGREVVGALLTEPGDFTFVRPLGKAD